MSLVRKLASTCYVRMVDDEEGGEDGEMGHISQTTLFYNSEELM